MNFDVSSSTSENKRLVFGFPGFTANVINYDKVGPRTISKIGYAQERRILKLGTTSLKVRNEPTYRVTLNMDEGVLRRPVRAHS